MATLTATRAGDSFPVFTPTGAGILCRAYGTITLAANPAQNDVLEFCKVPAGATVTGGWVMAADIDTGTEALDIDIGWLANGNEVADTDGFGNMGVLTGDAVTEYKPEVGTLRPLAGVLLSAGPKTFAVETTIAGLVNAAANAGGTGQITVMVDYLVS